MITNAQSGGHLVGAQQEAGVAQLRGHQLGHVLADGAVVQALRAVDQVHLRRPAVQGLG